MLAEKLSAAEKKLRVSEKEKEKKLLEKKDLEKVLRDI